MCQTSADAVSQMPAQTEGSFVLAPFPQPATPQLQERHSPDHFAAPGQTDAAAPAPRKRKQKVARQARKQVRTSAARTGRVLEAVSSLKL